MFNQQSSMQCNCRHSSSCLRHYGCSTCLHEVFRISSKQNYLSTSMYLCYLAPITTQYRNQEPYVQCIRRIYSTFQQLLTRCSLILTSGGLSVTSCCRWFINYRYYYYCFYTGNTRCGNVSRKEKNVRRYVVAQHGA